MGPTTADTAATSDFKIALIAAVAANGVIGDGKTRPWHLPGDLKYFRTMTLGKPIVMGRVTWSIIGHALPDRPNIVLSRDPHFRASGAITATSLDHAYALARALPNQHPTREIMVIGGGQVYEAALEGALRVYLTQIEATFDGRVRFPALDPKKWQVIERREPKPDPKDSHGYTFVTFERR